LGPVPQHYLASPAASGDASGHHRHHLTFNAFNVIYLITQGGPSEQTDILVTALFKAAFEFYRYAQAGAFGIVIFAILAVIAVTWVRVSGALKGVYE
jgi:arabinogalactan oligomer/maltooligosaccharide transport system permease protein